MHRQPLLQLLHQHIPYNAMEANHLAQIIEFVAQNPLCFERSWQAGHITASPWLVNFTREKVLLTHHRQLDRWLQPGGHADGETDALRVALTEAKEESGLLEIQPIYTHIFDVDVHEIPPKGLLPAHLHYDIRFVLAANEQAPLAVAERESKELRWVHLPEVLLLNPDESLLRMVAKTIQLKSDEAGR